MTEKMSVLFCCERKEEEVRNADDKGSPNSCITTTSSSSPTTSTQTAQGLNKKQRFSCGSAVCMDKKSEGEKVFRRSTDEESDDDEAESQLNGVLDSMGSLEDALPVKRGLSRFFNGKSKSFANLQEVRSIEDIKKPETLFNKRKRILRGSKSYPAVQLLSMPEEDDSLDEQGQQSELETTKKIKVEKEMDSKV